MKGPVIAALALIAPWLAATPALAQNAPAPQPVSVEMLAGACTACHGPEGRSPGAIPTIAGKPEAELLEHLRGFKSGDLQGTIMNRHAVGYSDSELQALARHFAAK